MEGRPLPALSGLFAGPRTLRAATHAPRHEVPSWHWPFVRTPRLVPSPRRATSRSGARTASPDPAYGPRGFAAALADARPSQDLRRDPTTTRDVPSVPSPSLPEQRDITALYHAHRLELVRLATLLIDDQETAEDVVQDAFAAAYQRRGPDLAGVDDPLRYLRRSVVNGARSVLRRRRTARLWVPPHVPPAPSPEDDAIRAEEDHQLRAALDTLRPRQREVLVLRYYAGLTEAEIARTLGMAQGTVKSTANRALKRLHRMLESHR